MKQKEKIAEARLIDWSILIDVEQIALDYEVEQINRTQIRLSKNGKRIDIYPKGMKFCRIPENEWGVIPDLKAFLHEEF